MMWLSAATSNHPAVQRAVFALRHLRSLQRWLCAHAPPLQRVMYYYTPDGWLVQQGRPHVLIPTGILIIPDVTPPYCARDTSYIVVGAEWPPLKKRLDELRVPPLQEVWRIQHYFARVFRWRERRGLRVPRAAHPELAVVAQVWGCSEERLVEAAAEVCYRYWRRKPPKRRRQIHLLCGWSPPCIGDRHIWVGRSWLKRALRAARLI
jgi:hypothetical protein